MDKSTCSSGGTSSIADERAGLVSEIEGIDFEGLDDADRDPGARRRRRRARAGTGPAGRRVTGSPGPTANASRGGTPRRSARRPWRPARSPSWSSRGGSGTRLGFDGPKGTYPIGPVSAASLFQIHAEKVVALGRRYGKTLPLYIMTSPENHEATARFFAENGQFGLEHVRFFVQGQMPAVDRESGKILLAEKGHLALSPDGHGGTLKALAAPGPDGTPSCLDEMRERGIRTIFYFQVDNPLVKIADPAFLGLHRQADAEMSFKVVEKQIARGEARGRGERRRPPSGDRVLRPPRRAGRAPRARRRASSSGPGASPST